MVANNVGFKVFQSLAILKIYLVVFNFHDIYTSIDLKYYDKQQIKILKINSLVKALLL